MTECCAVLSPQEQRLQDEIAGKKVNFSRPRAYGILQEIITKKPIIDVERAKYFTESMMETEGEALILRWAKAMRHVAENCTVYIDDKQLIAGRVGCEGRYGILYPELDGDFLDLAIEALPSRVESPFEISDSDAKIVINDIAPYWKGKTYHEALANALPKETLRYTFDPNDPMKSRFIVNETSSFRSSIQWVHDYEKVLNKGLKSIIELAESKLAELDPMSPVDQTDRKSFFEAIIIDCQAIIHWARRHAVLAREKAAVETDPQRKQELLDMAERCEWVPENPARDFREAVQSQWFIQMWSRVEQKTGTIISNGRMDQYFYPYYQQDVEAGKLTDEDVLELFECMWVGMAQFIDLYISPTGGAFNEGYAHWEAVTIGGQTKDGRDATNDLTYLFLQSKREFPLHYPDLAARIHSRAPERYLFEVAETIKEGSGFPKLINDEEVIPLNLAKGAKLEDAYDYAVSGCSESRMPNVETYTSPCAYINFPAALEMTMYNGKMRLHGDEQIGLQTGDPREFKTWDEFYNAYMTQQMSFLKHAFIQQHTINNLRQNHFAWPLGTALNDTAMKAELDLHTTHIPGGIDLGYFELMGYGTLVDSLCVIKKLVFEDKKISMDTLIKAMETNFEKNDVLCKLIENAPKFGTNDPYADAIAKEIDRTCLEFTRKYSQQLGIHLDLRLVPFTSHVPFGKVVSATPNGRKQYTPLSDGASASQGCDAKGPTAVLVSNFNSKNYDYRERASRLLNIKFSPVTMAGEEGTEKLVNFIKTWCDLKLWHIQFNVLNQSTLVAAKKDPAKYKGLIVRIAGYSAYFTDLSPDLQDDLIARAEHTTV